MWPKKMINWGFMKQLKVCHEIYDNGRLVPCENCDNNKKKNT
jgi:hypothetical protein